MNIKNGIPETITIAHGNGGRLTQNLVESLFLPHFDSPELNELSDGARIRLEGNHHILTTDSHVVRPLFFPGGDIGSLAVNGTVNDLAVSGARPLYLSAGFIIEEGFPGEDLRRIVASMAAAARQAGVRIVTGDTKVVERGAADGLYINTAGVGELRDDAPAGMGSVEEGYAVLLSGTIGDHGMAIYSIREGMDFKSDLVSDSAAITPLADLALRASRRIAVMRDPTRGGLATTLNEFTSGRDFTIEIDEDAIPVRRQVRGLCEILGFDPLHVANEGKLVLLVHPDDAKQVLSAMRTHPLGAEAAIIGRVTKRMAGRVVLKTTIGGERLLDMLTGDMLPRIC